MILALDQSSQKTGYCVGVAGEDKPRVFSLGIWKFKGHWADRLDSLEDFLAAFLKHPCPYKVLAYEVPTKGRGPRTNFVTTKRLGAAEYVVVKMGRWQGSVRVLGFDTSTVNHSGYGKRNMEASAAMAGRPVTLDEADAIAVYALAWDVFNKKPRGHKFTEHTK